MQKKYSEPDRTNSNNYMLDTSAYNHIMESAEKMDAAKKIYNIWILLLLNSITG